MLILLLCSRGPSIAVHVYMDRKGGFAFENDCMASFVNHPSLSAGVRTKWHRKKNSSNSSKVFNACDVEYLTTVGMRFFLEPLTIPYKTGRLSRACHASLKKQACLQTPITEILFVPITVPTVPSSSFANVYPCRVQEC